MVDQEKSIVRKPIRVLLIAPEHPTGTQFHRMIVPNCALDPKEFEVLVAHDLSQVMKRDFEGIDVVILSRLITSFMIKGDTKNMVEKACLSYLKEYKNKLIVDIDDIPQIPETFRLYETQKKDKTAESIITSLKRADVIWTTTEPLKKKIQKLIATTAKKQSQKPVLIVPNGISKHDGQWTTKKLKHPDLRIGVACMDNHWPDIKLLKPVLKKLENVKGWRIMAMGCDVEYKAEVKKLLGTDRITFVPWVSPYEYATQYRKIDLLLCPLSHNAYNSCRSDIKFAEAAHSNTPVIAENFGPYKGHKCAIDDWSKLEQIVKDYVTGKPKVLDQFRITDTENYNTDKADEIRINSIKELVHGKPKRPITKKKVPANTIRRKKAAKPS